MNALATLVLLCAVMPIRVALLIAGIGGWLFLPEAGFTSLRLDR